MRLKGVYQLLLLAVVVMGAYYPALSSGMNSVDDPHIIAAYEEGGRTLAQIATPAASYYFRPVTELSYYLDDLLWSLHPRFMHLENILLHLGNSLLVFLLARLLATGWGIRARWFPLASSLLFALHPVNSESVIWIAGRTDPLAAFFVLAAFCLLLRSLIADTLRYLWPALLSFVLGVLAKEIALCFLPVALLLALSWPGHLRVRKSMVALLSAVSLCGVLFVLAYALLAGSFSITALVHSNSGPVSALLKAVLTALGFYLKKLVFPLPLNFAIDVVSPLYLYPGILVLLLLPLCLRRRSLPLLLALACAIFLLPALLISVKQVAWTPFAERYLYLPSAFFCLGVTGALSAARWTVNRERLLLLTALGLAAVTGLVTFQRAVLWQDNLALYRDTVRNSPGFAGAHLELATALLRKGELREGRVELEAAERLNKRPSVKYPIKAGLMALMLREGNSQGAKDYFYQVFPEKKQADVDFLCLLDSADAALAIKATELQVRNGLYADMLDTYALLYRKTRQPFYLYQASKVAIRVGDRAGAAAYLRQALHEAPADAHYAAAAVKTLHKLEAGP
jgi:protein O-mannosyl-transferase